jgi:hypothetical protein
MVLADMELARVSFLALSSQRTTPTGFCSKLYLIRSISLFTCSRGTPLRDQDHLGRAASKATACVSATALPPMVSVPDAVFAAFRDRHPLGMYRRGPDDHSKDDQSDARTPCQAHETSLQWAAAVWAKRAVLKESRLGLDSLAAVPPLTPSEWCYIL